MAAELTPDKVALTEAAQFAGGQTALARELQKRLGRDVSQQWVWQVINTSRRIPPEWAIPLEEIMEGRKTRHDFRPDLYPAPKPEEGQAAA